MIRSGPNQPAAARNPISPFPFPLRGKPVSFVMLEHRQRAIHIHHSLVPALDRYSIGDALCTRRENR
jgi:hypothetical protein